MARVVVSMLLESGSSRRADHSRSALVDLDISPFNIVPPTQSERFTRVLIVKKSNVLHAPGPAQYIKAFATTISYRVGSCCMTSVSNMADAGTMPPLIRCVVLLSEMRSR